MRPAPRDGVDVRSLFAASSCALLVAVALEIVQGRGLLAVSDDDYARVVIAQEFAAHPSWDPSGTSWLPFPFWMTGLALKMLGATLSHARSATVAFNAMSCALLWAIGHKLGLSRAASACLTLATALLPSALWLGAAPIPEFSSALSITISCLSLLTPSSSWWRVLGGCTISLACASRYEAWPVALGIVALNAWDATGASRARRHVEVGRLTLACGVSSLFPVAWMLHGAQHHQDALFFVQRVSKYRTALGLGSPSLHELIAGYPRALLLVEPMPMLLALGALVWSLTQRRGQLSRAVTLSPHCGVGRVVSLLVLHVVMLVLGEARGGAPTHHPERALLAVWTTTGFLAGYLWCTRIAGCTTRSVASCCGVYLLGAHLLSPWGERLAASRLRAPEETTGRQLGARYPHATVGLATTDYGYFSIMAAAGEPSRFKIWSRHDPREARVAAALTEWVKEQPISALVASRDLAVKHALPIDVPSGGSAAPSSVLFPVHQSKAFIVYAVRR